MTVFPRYTLDISLTFPPVAVFLVSFLLLSATQPNVLTGESATLSRITVEAALWEAELKPSLAPRLSIITPSLTCTNPESRFYQIREGTKAFVTVVTGQVLDGVASLPQTRWSKMLREQTEGLFTVWRFVSAAAHALTSDSHPGKSKFRFRCPSGGCCKTCLYSTYLCKKVPGLHEVGMVELLSWCISASEGW